MPAITTTTWAVAIEELWTPELNRAIEFDLVIMPLFEDKTAWLKTGDTARLPSRHNLTANTKGAGDLTPETITETDQTFQVTTHQATAVQVEDIAEIQSKYNIRNEQTMAASYALARAQDVSAAALLDDNTTQTVGTLGAELTDDNMIRAQQYLVESSAPDRRSTVVAPATYSGFLKLDKFINQLYNGDQSGRAVNRAQVGQIYGSTVYQSNLTIGSSPNSSGHMFAFGHFIKIVQRKPTVHVTYEPLALAFVVTMDQIYGAFERQEADEAAVATTSARLWGVRLQSVK